jgi:hypothetical protein
MSDPRLLGLAKRNVWWLAPDEALEYAQRVIARIMDMGTFEDIQELSACRRHSAAHASSEGFMSSFKPHLEVLPQSQKETWSTLGWTTTNRFVLYGGTAIVLRCGHRASIDFDFFTDQQLNQAIIFKEIRESGMAFRVVQDEKNSLTVVAETGDVRLSFFGGLEMGRVGVPELTDDGVVLVASSLDVLGTKLKVIMQRAESKDYSNIAQLLRAAPSLIQGLGSAQSLYGSAFAPAECLRALTFFDDGDLTRVNAETRKVLRTEAAKASRVFPIPSMEKISGQLSDDGTIRRANRDRGGLEL